MRISAEQAEMLACEDECNPLLVVHREDVDEGRWTIVERVVFQDVRTGRFYDFTWARAKTENQDDDPFESVDCPEVFKKTKTVEVYE